MLNKRLVKICDIESPKFKDYKRVVWCGQLLAPPIIQSSYIYDLITQVYLEPYIQNKVKLWEIKTKSGKPVLYQDRFFPILLKWSDHDGIERYSEVSLTV